MSVKGVAVQAGRVLLLENERSEWEFPEVRFFVSAPQELVSGQCYLLGAPWLPNCEVVEVADDEPSDDGSRRIGRARFKTVATSYPAGTSVIAVTATFVEDWSCADSADQER